MTTRKNNCYRREGRRVCRRTSSLRFEGTHRPVRCVQRSEPFTISKSGERPTRYISPRRLAVSIDLFVAFTKKLRYALAMLSNSAFFVRADRNGRYGTKNLRPLTPLTWGGSR